jgi:hypothetical protein
VDLRDSPLRVVTGRGRDPGAQVSDLMGGVLVRGGSELVGRRVAVERGSRSTSTQ